MLTINIVTEHDKSEKKLIKNQIITFNNLDLIEMKSGATKISYERSNVNHIEMGQIKKINSFNGIFVV